MGKGSGTVTTFSRADGFATIGRHQEIVEAGTIVDVQLLGRELQLADLVVIGSHCIGLDYLLGRAAAAGRALQVARGRQHRRPGRRQARRMRPGRHPPARLRRPTSTTGRFSRPALELIAGYGRAAGHRLSPRRRPLRGPHGAQTAIADGGRRSGVRDGQPQPGQRHARADRPAARRRQARRLCRAAEESQRRGRRRVPGPRRLGRGAGHGRAQRRARLPAGAGGTVRLRRAEVARRSARPSWRSRRCCRTASTARRWRAWA